MSGPVASAASSVGQTSPPFLRGLLVCIWRPAWPSLQITTSCKNTTSSSKTNTSKHHKHYSTPHTAAAVLCQQCSTSLTMQYFFNNAVLFQQCNTFSTMQYFWYNAVHFLQFFDNTVQSLQYFSLHNTVLSQEKYSNTNAKSFITSKTLFMLCYGVCL